MADVQNIELADRLVQLAYALQDERLPLATRAEYVKRELANEAKALLATDGVDTSDGGHKK